MVGNGMEAGRFSDGEKERLYTRANSGANRTGSGIEEHGSTERENARSPLNKGDFSLQRVQGPHMVRSVNIDPPVTVIETEDENEKPLHYKISETPPVHLLVLFALQQTLIGITAPLSAALVVSEVVCAQKDDAIKQFILSASTFMVGVATFLMSTFGVRLPIFQGPSPTYVIPLLAMSRSPEWTCPNIVEGTDDANNSTLLLAELGNGTYTPATNIILGKLGELSGTLALVGVIHFLIGATGLVGILVRYIGPVTLAPTILVVALEYYRVIARFARPSMLVTAVTCLVSLVLSLFLANKLTPLPSWSRARGFHINWFPFHEMFSVLISILMGWAFSGILTIAGFFTDDPTSYEYLARTDAKAGIIYDAPLFEIPYPGKLGSYSFSSAAFLSFLIACILSVFDSIGDYSACAKAAKVPPPPRFAFNRGIAVEGLATIMSGGLGCCHATVSKGANIGAMRITGVASRRVFQLSGLIFVLISIIGKLGAVLLTIPLPVLGGSSLVMTGIFVGLALSYLESVNLRSTRNLAIIGIALLTAYLLPHWAKQNTDQIDTGYKKENLWVTVLITNPCFIAGALSCFMDNTVSGTIKERGLMDMIKELDGTEEDSLSQKQTHFEEGREVYRLPFIPYSFRLSKVSKIIPLFYHAEC